MSQEDITIHHKTPSTEFILVLHRNFFVHVLCQSLQGYTSVFCKFHQTSTIKQSTNQSKSSKNQPTTNQKSAKSSNSELPRLFFAALQPPAVGPRPGLIGFMFAHHPTETTSSPAKRRVQRFLGPLLRLSSALKKSESSEASWMMVGQNWWFQE